MGTLGRALVCYPSTYLAVNPPCRRRRHCLIVRAGYTKKPTGTPGAYQLIDDRTGEKVIVWGGANDDAGDSPTPSHGVIFLKAGEQSPRITSTNKLPDGMPSSFNDDLDGRSLLLAAVDGKAKRKSNGNVASGFGRLKSQQVRDLIKKSSRSKQGDRNHRDKALHGDSRLLPNANSNSAVQHDQVGLKKVKNHRNHDSDDDDISEASPSPLDFSPSKRGWRSPTSPRSDSLQRTKMRSVAGFFSRKSFEDLGCTDVMIESLKAQGFYRPSHIQGMAYEPVLRRNSCIIADQSGSGKTLAYLAPSIQYLVDEELQGIGKSKPGCPRMVILVPTSELASQVLKNCRSISKSGVPFKSMVATGGFRQKTQLDNLNQELDVLIATPGHFMFLLQEGFLQLSNLKCAVLDEVDVLFGDDEFEEVLQRLLKLAPVTSQYLFVTATLPVDIYNTLVELFPDSNVILGPGMHRTSSGLEEVLVDCSGNEGEEKTPETAFLNKKAALIKIMENPVSRTIIFCNKIETCRKVENILKRFDRKEEQTRVLPFHAALAQEVRLANIKEFLVSESKNSLYLICTDRASRGIDFVNVDHVILFDFPRDPSEYVRRVGRTARGAGGKGKAFVFVVGKQVSLARRIIERNLTGHPLHDVPSLTR